MIAACSISARSRSPSCAATRAASSSACASASSPRRSSSSPRRARSRSPGCAPTRSRERFRDELLGLGAQALELLPGAQGRRVAVVQVAASLELRLAAPGARQFAAHARELGGRLVVRLCARQRLASRRAQLGELRRQLCRARLAAAIGAPERVRAARELLGRDRRRSQEGR